MASSIDPALRFSPVVAFDVDGVLRVRRIPERRGSAIIEQGELIDLEITLEQEEYPSIYHGQPHWDERGKSTRIESFSQAAVELIRTLAEDPRTEPVYATTWQRWANYYFNSALDLPELPVAVETLDPPELNYAHCSPAWKTAQLARQFDGRPLIWIDDNMPDRDSEDLASLRRPIDRGITRSFRTSPYTGVTPRDIEEVLRWVELATTAEGQEELRAQRRAQVTYERRQMAKVLRQRDRERKAFETVRDRALELYPQHGQRFATAIGSIGQSRGGLSVYNVALLLQRHPYITADPAELAASLRIPRYHLRDRAEAEDRDAGFDERYDF